MGSGGNITVKFANLIKKMWSGKESKIYPMELLKTLGQYASHVSFTFDHNLFLACLWITIRCIRILGIPFRYPS